MVTVVGKNIALVKQVTCRSCASILQYTDSECRDKNHSYDYLGDFERGKAITCPNCGKDVIVK